MSDPAPVLIVGAGPTGLWLALWLTRLGIRVRIVDRAAEPGTTSRALAVHARTMEFGHQVGIAHALVEAGVRVEALNLWAGGRHAARVPIRRIGEGLSPFPFPLFLPQDVHERLLIERLEDLGVTVERSIALTRVEQDEQRVRAVLTRDGADEIVEAAYLAGCDGASSTVRDHLGIGFPGGTYSGAFYVADGDASGPAVDGGVHVDIEDEDFAIVFQLKTRGRVRLIGVLLERSDPEREMNFEDVRGKAIAHLQLDVTTVHWFSTYRVHHRVAERFRSGRVFLLGDAAHIHSPVGGQGMNTGIGDAVNLSWKLAAVWRPTAVRRRIPARDLRARANRLRTAVGRHNRSCLYRGDCAGRAGANRTNEAGAGNCADGHAARGVAAADLPHHFADTHRVSPQRAQCRPGRRHPRRRSPAVVRAIAGRQLRAVDLARMAGARVWRGASRSAAGVHASGPRASSLPVETEDGGSRIQTRRPLSDQAGRLRRIG